MSVTWMVIGDVREILDALPAGCIDLTFSSPPFLGVRHYLPDGHPDTSKEIGAEPNPGEFVDALLDVTEHIAAKLAWYGSLAFELGDTYAAASGDRSGEGWPQAKSLALIPEAYRLALVYGENPHRTSCGTCSGTGSVVSGGCADCFGTGRWHRPTPTWRARNVVRWCKSNPTPSFLGDRFRAGTNDIVVACKSDRRWFDLDATRSPQHHTPDVRHQQELVAAPGNGVDDPGPALERAGGSPPLDWWEYPTAVYQGMHYAVMNPDVCVRPIASMCPQRVCRFCGVPSERISVPSDEYLKKRGGSGDFSRHRRGSSDLVEGNAAKSNESGFTAEYVTLGWSCCGCTGCPGGDSPQAVCSTDHWRPGRVLDPFGGSGTTGMVATGMGRDAILIDLDDRNLAHARDRVGPMFFREVTVEELVDVLTQEQVSV